MRRLLPALVVLAAFSHVRTSELRPMSLHNRALLNRAAVLGLRAIELMIAVSDGGFERATALVAGAGGRVRFESRRVGYVRAEIPIESLLGVVSDSSVEAYQISTDSEGSWEYDLRTERSAEGFRNLEARPTGDGATATEPRLPLLAVQQSRQDGFTADTDTGLDEWFKTHPTYDGRGVTIALLETAQPELNHPTLRTAKTLDGRGVPKIAGVINSFDPSEPDETRVDLDTEIDAASTWRRAGDRTYILPRAGRYRFGRLTLPSGDHLYHHFGVIQRQDSGEIWIDTDGDADFRDERPMSDVNERVDIGVLKLLRPQPMDLGFVVARGRAANTVHVYVSRGDHYAMVISVAAGSRTDDGLAYGVAPNARVLLVRHYAGQFNLRQMIEGYIHAAARPDVDLLGAASGYNFLPETSRSFAGVLFTRISAAYGKPIFQGAGNSNLRMTTSLSLGDAFSVGGSVGPPTFAAFIGGATLPALMVHPTSAAGPSIDGSLTPDFIAPVHRIAASLWNSGRNVAVPRNGPTHVLPRGYRNSCCTSASGPYAAGIAALLISAAKQEGLSYSFERFQRAVRVGARFLEGWPAHQQGHGVLNVGGAWRELKNPIEIPRIRVAAKVVHPLAQYSPSGTVGRGLFEWEGWRVNMTGRRNIVLTRESGSTRTVTYRVSWTGNDGSFSAPRSIALPRDGVIALPVDVNTRTTGVHSAILNLHEPASDAIVLRVPATIVAPERFDPKSLTMTLSGRIDVMRRNAHYLAVPEGVGAMIVDLEVRRGSTRVNIVPAHGVYSPQEQRRPMPGRTFTEGRYTVVFPSPARGTWTIDADNVSLRSEADASLVSAEPVEYAITVRLQRASLRTRAIDGSRLYVDVESSGAPLAEPVLQTAFGALRSHHGRLLASGLPTLHEIDVPADASALDLRLRAVDPNTMLELSLYDCSSGECFYLDSTIPSGPRHEMMVRRPKPGRWIAAVNSAPLPSMDAAFDLDVIVAGAAKRHAGARSAIDPGTPPSLDRDATRVLMCELIDAAVERDEIARPWEDRDFLPKRPQSPAAAARTVHVMR
ncbi:MAG TPA: S8 family serine peptidase [Vicinamibacterales bacterium]